jgi:hypothetical protein
MPPTLGSVHLRPRLDSGAAALWQWARRRRGPWTCPDAADACGISASRCRRIVAAMQEAGYLDKVESAAPAAPDHRGRRIGATPNEWRLSAAGRELRGAPVMITDATNGTIVGFRPAQCCIPAMR